MKIGFRTLKTAVGAGLAVWIAHLCQLEYANSAAIITILCIEKTKKKSIKASLNRFLACTLGLLLSSLFFHLFGYNTLVFSIFIAFFIPLLVRLKIQSGFVTSIVIVLHILTIGKMNLSIAMDEFLLILIGVGVAILLNSYMPNLKQTLLSNKESVESQFKEILHQYASYLKHGDQGWDGKEILTVEKLLEESKILSLQASENYLFQDQKGFFFYFDMREKQFEILKRMLPIISTLSNDIEQRHMFADFLFELSANVKTTNTAHVYLDKLHKEQAKMKELPLPTIREDFETRASVYHLMNEMDYYLQTKIKFFHQNETKLHTIQS